MAIGYFKKELARDICIGQSEEKILKKYKRWRLSKNRLRHLVTEDEEFMAELSRLNKLADEVAMQIKKRMVLLSVEALDRVEEIIRIPKTVEIDGKNQLNPDWNQKLIKETSVDLLKISGVSEVEKGKSSELIVRLSREAPVAEIKVEEPEPLPVGEIISFPIKIDEKKVANV